MGITWGIITIVTLIVLLVFGLKSPQGLLALYLNGLFVATLLLTHTGISMFAGGSVLILTTIALAVYLFREVGLRRFWAQAKGFLPLLIVLMAIELAVAFVYGTRSSYGLLKIIRFLTIDFYFFFGIVLFAHSQEKLNSFLKFIAGIGLAYAFTAVIGMLIGDPQAMYGWNNRIWFSRSLGLTFLVIYYFIGMGRERQYGLLALAAAFFLAMMFLNASRGPVIALFCALVTFELFDFSGKSLKHRAVKILITSVVFYTIFWSGSPITKPLEEAAAHNDQLITIEEKFQSDAGGTGNDRIAIWKATLQMIKEHPILGIGTGSFQYTYEVKDVTYRYPHNIVLEVMVEQGIPGTVLWLAFYLTVLHFAFHGFWRKPQANGLYLLGLSMLVFGTVNALLSGDIADNNNIFVAAGLIWSAYVLERREFFH